MEPTVSRYPASGEYSIELRLRILSLDQGIAELRCPDCGQPLTLHQPDENRPYQLLATCDGCYRWFLLRDATDEGIKFVIFEIPSPPIVETVLRSRGASVRRSKKA